MARPVIKIARKGYDIRTAEPKHLALNSSKNQFKVYKSGLVTFDLNSANNYTHEEIIEHSFSYKPTVIAFVSDITESGGVVTASSSRFNSIPSFDSIDIWGYNPMTGVIEAQADQVIIRVKEPYVSPGLGGGTYFDVDDVVLRYLIFVDKNFE